jgi:CDP-diacylglycerol---glycerol-3-phosphate 3-phosphatidyltransferase
MWRLQRTQSAQQAEKINMTRIVFITEKNRRRYLSAVGPVGDFFARVGVHPNVLSLTGLTSSAAAGLLYSQGRFFWAAWVVLFAGICDTLDGHIARQTNKNSPFGAFFDSTLDRYSDMFLFVGLAYFYAGGRSFSPVGAGGQASPWTVVIIILAIAGSFMVSYTRARAEGLGVQCKAGMMQRPERITLLIIGSLLGSIPVAGAVFMKLALLVLAVSVNLTALYRMFYVRNRLAHGNESQ